MKTILSFCIIAMSCVVFMQCKQSGKDSTMRDKVEEAQKDIEQERQDMSKDLRQFGVRAATGVACGTGAAAAMLAAVPLFQRRRLHSLLLPRLSTAVLFLAKMTVPWDC